MALYGSGDAVYLRSLEAERNGLSAPITVYYSIQRGMNVDPLYGEPVSWSFDKTKDVGTDIVGAIEYVESDQRDPSVNSIGFEAMRDATLSYARDVWELAMGAIVFPKEGDVVFAHNIWWDVKNAGYGGTVNDTTEFVGYKLLLVSRSKFEPDRKFGRANNSIQR